MQVKLEQRRPLRNGESTPINPFGQHSQVELIDATRARELLGTQINPRHINQGRVARYVSSQLRKEWRLHHQGIAIDVNGHLRDGQHRLTAIVRTDIPMVVYVTYNVDPDALLHIDEQMPRSIATAIRAAEKGDYRSSEIAVARIFIELPDIFQYQQSEVMEKVIDVLQKYGKEIECAEKHLKTRKKGITKAVRALIARAKCHIDNDSRLVEFCSLIMGEQGLGAVPEEDSAAVMYRELVLKRLIGRTDIHSEVERYQKGQIALKRFLNSRTIERERLMDRGRDIKGTRDDLFPIDKGDCEEPYDEC